MNREGKLRIFRQQAAELGLRLDDDTFDATVAAALDREAHLAKVSAIRYPYVGASAEPQTAFAWIRSGGRRR